MGPGVRRDEKKKKGLVLFFELLTRKFGSYVSLNLTYLVTLLPGIMAVWFSLMYCMTELLEKADLTFSITMLTLTVSIIISVLFGLSPFSSGYYYVLRNFVKEDNAWVLTDMLGKFKNNLGKSILIFVIDLAIVCFSFFGLRVYILSGVQFGIYGLLLIMAIFALSVPYRWNMLVTFELKTREIYKNSIYLLFVNSKRNAMYILSVLLFALTMGLLTYMASVVAIILTAIVGISCFGLVQEINVYPTIEELLIKPQKNRE